MDKALRVRAIVVGHLILTVPAIAGSLLVPFFGLREFGQTLFFCYILAGIALAWQWYSVALPVWKKWLLGKGIQLRGCRAPCTPRWFCVASRVSNWPLCSSYHSGRSVWTLPWAVAPQSPVCLDNATIWTSKPRSYW
jgi:hypothetical protein